MHKSTYASRISCLLFTFLVRISREGLPIETGKKWVVSVASYEAGRKNTATWLFYATDGEIMFLSPIIINIRGQIENRPLENTRFAGRKWLLAGR